MFENKNRLAIIFMKIEYKGGEKTMVAKWPWELIPLDGEGLISPKND